MWTAPEGASAIYSAGARSVAAPTSEVSPVRSPLAARPPGALRHNRATPARHRVLPPSRCLRGRRAGCPATCRATIKVRIPDNQDEKVVAGLAPQGGRSPTGGASPATTGDEALSRASIVM